MKGKNQTGIPLTPGPFQAKNRYGVRLANRRAPGVCFLLGFRVYLFWPEMDQVYVPFSWLKGYKVLNPFGTWEQKR